MANAKFPAGHSLACLRNRTREGSGLQRTEPGGGSTEGLRFAGQRPWGQELGFYSKRDGSHWKVLSAVLWDMTTVFTRSLCLLWGGQVVVTQEGSRETYQGPARMRVGWTQVETVDMLSRHGLRACVGAEWLNLMLDTMRAPGERRVGEDRMHQGKTRVRDGL